MLLRSRIATSVPCRHPWFAQVTLLSEALARTPAPDALCCLTPTNVYLRPLSILSSFLMQGHGILFPSSGSPSRHSQSLVLKTQTTGLACTHHGIPGARHHRPPAIDSFHTRNNADRRVHQLKMQESRTVTTGPIARRCVGTSKNLDVVSGLSVKLTITYVGSLPAADAHETPPPSILQTSLRSRIARDGCLPNQNLWENVGKHTHSSCASHSPERGGGTRPGSRIPVRSASSLVAEVPMSFQDLSLYSSHTTMRPASVLTSNCSPRHANTTKVTLQERTPLKKIFGSLPVLSLGSYSFEIGVFIPLKYIKILASAQATQRHSSSHSVS